MTSPRKTPAELATLAVQAIREEALLTPKPGLVDRNGPGGHTDMDLALLLRSADSLFETFRDLADLGCQTGTAAQVENSTLENGTLDDQELRDRVGVLGRKGEARMLDATGGVNTHRGALWTLGLLVIAAGSASTEAGLFDIAARIAGTPDAAAPPAPPSHGQRAVRRYGVSGAIGEASAGFPHIAHIALPEIRASLSRGHTEDQARLRALFALIATVDDTCILHRGGTSGLQWMQRSAERALRSPRFDSAARRFSLRADRARLSPGGSADLIAGAIFVHSLTLDRMAVVHGTRNASLQEASHANV